MGNDAFGGVENKMTAGGSGELGSECTFPGPGSCNGNLTCLGSNDSEGNFHGTCVRR